MTNTISRETAVQLPIKHVSYSGIRQFTSDQQLFAKRYIRLDFNEEKGLAQLVGVACHEAVEFSLSNECYDPQKLFEVAQKSFISEVEKAIINGWDKWRDDKKLPAVTPQENIQNTLVEIEKLTQDEEGLNSRFRYLEWLKEENVIEKAENNMNQGICNFLDNRDGYTLIGAEMDIFTMFKDLEGNDMPLPLKAKIDVCTMDGELIVGIDNKFKAKLSSDEETIFPAYEMQAGFYKIALEAELGRKVDRFEFNEIKTGEATAPKLLQAELNKLMDENGLEYDKFMKNADKTDILVKMGVLKMGAVFKKVVIDFNKKPYIHAVCVETYKRFLNQLNLVYQSDSKFLPNFSSFFDSLEGYVDYVQEVASTI